MAKELKKFDIDPEKLMDYLTEESPDTFLPNKVFSDPKVSGPIERIVVPQKGGVDVYIKGLKYPIAQYPYRPMVKTACIIKRMSMILMHFFGSLMNKRGIIGLIFLKRSIGDLIPKLIILFSLVIGSRRLRERYYSHSVREIYRAFNIMAEREIPKERKERWIRIRDIACLVLEFDNAYRSRLQDFLSEIDIKKIKLTKRDLFFARQSGDYNFGGKKE